MNPDDVLFEVAAREVSDQTCVKGIMARAFSDALGDKEKTLALYLKYRVANLKEEQEIFLNRKKQEEQATRDKLEKIEEDRKRSEATDKDKMEQQLFTICKKCGYMGQMEPSIIGYVAFSFDTTCKCPKCSYHFTWYYIPPEKRS